ncbi:Wzz/FepE/Etk N-terminal domain-containing protein [Thorsellia kenyensis]|uniref:Wzz/FepE/Etk N-terminal domain-containing protein n=1 Tax=Thorsellia kenyensis TaxID=1549888 RepID=A0ABV6C9N1_9GAMM
MNSESKHHESNDEIDLKELVITLWKGKWFIALIAIIMMILGLLYSTFIQTQTSTLSINALPSYKANAYNELNAQLAQLNKELTPFVSSEKSEERKALNLSSGFLLSKLMERLSSRENLLEIAKKINLIPKKKLNDEEWNEAIIGFIYDINILPPLSAEELAVNKSPNPRRYWEISSSNVKDSEAYTNLLNQSLAESNEFVRVTILNEIEKEIKLLQLLKNHEIENINTDINNLKARYEQVIEQRKAELIEQAQIARQLNIAKNTLEGKEFINVPNVISTSTENSSPLYFRGYEALESQLALLNERKNIEQFIPELVQLNDRKRVLENNQLEERLTQAINNSPLADKTLFQAANLDINKIKFVSKPNKWILLFLLGFLGIAIGAVFVLLKETLFSKKVL